MKKYFILLTIAILTMGCIENKKPMETQTLFVGTYTDGDSEGIYTLQFNPETGILDSLQLKVKLPNPSFLTISADSKNLYAVQETADFDSLGGGITAFSMEDKVLTELNSKGSGGAHPCHVALSGDGQLGVSNYTGGNLAIFDLKADGSLGDRQLIDHKVLDTARTAHVHQTYFNEDGLLVADLGLDDLMRYMKQPHGWIPGKQATISLPEDAGPRHFALSKNRNFIYVINELNATIAVFKKDQEGNYNPIQTESTIAADWTEPNACAEILLSPDGKFLYGSNRGENTIVIFSVAEDSGKISLLGRESVGGDWPRNFTLSPDGNHLLVANKKSNNIAVFKRDAATGLLVFTSNFEMAEPVCLVFSPKE